MSKELLNELKKILKDEFGIELSDKDTKDLGLFLVGSFNSLVNMRN